MTQYLITFPSDAMNHIPDEEMPEVGRAAHAVCQELIDAGVYVLSGGLDEEPANLVGTDGTVTDGPRPDHRRNHDRGRAFTRGRAEVGCQDRCCVPLYAGSTGDPYTPRRTAYCASPPGRAPRMQNSFPSGSASTVHDSSPVCPTSA
jgi:hypothetical protein